MRMQRDQGKKMDHPDDGLLFFFPESMERIDFKYVAPYDSKDLMVMISPTIGFRLYKMTDTDGKQFMSEKVMEDNRVFGCHDFSKRFVEFGESFELRLERFFLTNRERYLFFDEEEQRFMKDYFMNKRFTASVMIYLRPHVAEEFVYVPYTELSMMDHLSLLKFLRRYKAAIITRPESYYSLYNANNKSGDRDRFESMYKRKERQLLEKIYTRYGALREITTKEAMNYYYRLISMAMHPDLQKDQTLYAYVNIDFDDCKKTRWYEMLSKEVEHEAFVPKNLLNVSYNAKVGEEDEF